MLASRMSASTARYQSGCTLTTKASAAAPTTAATAMWTGARTTRGRGSRSSGALRPRAAEATAAISGHQPLGRGAGGGGAVDQLFEHGQKLVADHGRREQPLGLGARQGA